MFVKRALTAIFCVLCTVVTLQPANYFRPPKRGRGESLTESGLIKKFDLQKGGLIINGGGNRAFTAILLMAWRCWLDNSQSLTSTTEEAAWASG